MGRRKKLINHSDIPQYAIEAVARCIFPDILAFYQSEEGQREFAEWKQKQDNKDNNGDPSLDNISASDDRGGV